MTNLSNWRPCRKALFTSEVFGVHLLAARTDGQKDLDVHLAVTQNSTLFFTPSCNKTSLNLLLPIRLLLHPQYLSAVDPELSFILDNSIGSPISQLLKFYIFGFPTLQFTMLCSGNDVPVLPGSFSNDSSRFTLYSKPLAVLMLK